MIEQLARIPAAIVIYAIARLVTRKIGNRLERLPRTNLLFAFLVELASDVRNLGNGLAWFVAIAVPAISLWSWLLNPAVKMLYSYLMVVAGVAAIVFLNTVETWSIAHLRPDISARDRQFAMTMYPLLANLAKYFIYFFGIMFIFGVWGVDLIPILSGVGLVGLIVGLGAQSLISDMIAGFGVIFERLYYAGSEISILFSEGEAVEISGIVDRITWRITYIKEESGSIVAINNSELRIVRIIQK